MTEKRMKKQGVKPIPKPFSKTPLRMEGERKSGGFTLSFYGVKTILSCTETAIEFRSFGETFFVTGEHLTLGVLDRGLIVIYGDVREIKF